MRERIGVAAAFLLLIVSPVITFQSIPTMLFSSSSHQRNQVKQLNDPTANDSTDSKVTKTALYDLPKLIIFDLDNTLWTPELYQLRKLQRANITPRAGVDVQLMEGSIEVIRDYIPNLQKQGVQFGVASRTKSVEWAHSLLKQFELLDYLKFVEIFPGDKRTHFQNLQNATGISYDDMLFFDDARDGKYGNCEPVSELGVLSVHCPNGLYSVDVFTSALDKFKEWDGEPNHIVEWDGKLTKSTSKSKGTFNGSIKMVKTDKRYGFIQYNDNGKTRDIFFHFNGLSDISCNVEVGDQVSFLISQDAKTGKPTANKVNLLNLKPTTNKNNKNTIQLRCFSMNQPFAALLANGYKTLETRNGTMFTPYPEGTKMLLHVGQRTYPDENKHIQVMKSGGLSEEEIEKLKSLKPGFRRGNAIAIVELGKTYETTIEERSVPSFERKVAAYGADSGRMVTEIRRAAWLKSPVTVSGKGGVFKVDIDPDVIPEGWIIPQGGKIPGLYATITG